MINSPLVDFHCHLDLYPSLAAIIAECEREKVFTLAVTTTPRAWPRNKKLTSSTKFVRAALGLHPQLISPRTNELDIWRSHLDETRYIGEVGLDASPRYFKSIDLQKRVFETILRDCARRGDKILTIHSVRTARIVIDMLEQFLPPTRGKAVFHWFSGTKSEAERATNAGVYFSINHEMLRNDRHRAMISSLPLERLLTETDGPFTTTEGRVARPSDVAKTIDELARLRSMLGSDLRKSIAKNLKTLVGG